MDVKIISYFNQQIWLQSKNRFETCTPIINIKDGLKPNA